MRGEVQAIDCAVVGGGPAGLAASVALAEHGVDHVVLERDRVAGSCGPSAGTPSGSTPPAG